MCGVLFEVGDFEYFAPVSSFAKQQKTNFIIKNSKGKPVGCVRFSFMFPIPPDSRAVKDFNEEDYRRKRLLLEEYRYCNRKAQQIVSKARHVYRSVVEGADPHLVDVCCDFKALERYVERRAAGKND